jgi:hypothetical protein
MALLPLPGAGRESDCGPGYHSPMYGAFGGTMGYPG